MTLSVPVSNTADAPLKPTQPVHAWLRSLHVAFLPGRSSPALDEVIAGLRRAFDRSGHDVQDQPDDRTDVLFSIAPFGEPLPWREAPFFQARRLFGLRHSPTVWTMIHARPGPWADLQAHFERALAQTPPDPANFTFPGLAPTAHGTLIEQGLRGGPILSVERMLQAQAMCLRILVVVGEEHPHYAQHFDLVGAYPRSQAGSEGFYEDIVLRVATAISAEEIGKAAVAPPTITRAEWEAAPTPPGMHQASLALGERGFFTDMVRIADLVQVPALAGAVASQYSEGCFASWDPRLGALIATVTGSARPVDKGHITDNDLSPIVGIGPDGRSVAVRHVAGLQNDPPSSEAFEMWDMDLALPEVLLGAEFGHAGPAPVVRSKLHGHRGVAAYDPRYVEYVPIGPAYFSYPVTCATYAQAQGIKGAFARAQALQNPDDPRQVAFTLLPTHGVFIVEKWAPGKTPFQAIWEAMDAGWLQVDRRVPQGPEVFEPQHVGD